MKQGSSILPSKEPLWFNNMDPVFTDTNARI